MTLWEYRKAWCRQVSHLWVTDPTGNQGSYTTAAPTYPFTNLKGSLKTGNGFQLYKHCFDVSALFWQTWWVPLGQPFLPASIPPYGSGNPESGNPPPAITSATLNGATMEWTLSISNWYDFYNGYIAIYLSTPGVTKYSANQLFQIDAFEPADDSGNFSDNGDGIAAQLLKPYPSGSECLMGCRSLEGYLEGMPSALAYELITVD